MTPLSILGAFKLCAVLSSAAPGQVCQPIESAFAQHGVFQNGLRVSIALSSTSAGSGDVVDLWLQLSASHEMRFFTSGAPADYKVIVHDRGSNEDLETKASWYITISRVATVTVAPGHESYDCLRLSKMYDLTKAGSYQVTAVRVRPRVLPNSYSFDGERPLPPIRSNTLTLTVHE